MTTTRTGVKLRGFASMDKDKQRAIAQRGGHAAHAAGTAHQWNSETAAAAGRVGGRKGRGRRVSARQTP
jgi:general stress protein YciG